MDSALFSHGIDGLLDELNPQNQVVGFRRYPSDLDTAITRFRVDDTPHSWFRRYVDDSLHGNLNELESQAVENDLLVLAIVRWEQRGVLRYCRIQALKTTGLLTDFYSDPAIAASYVRMDVDEGTLGTGFSHPYPHLHAYPCLDFRVDMMGRSSSNVVVDFLESLYRYYYPTRWRRWAQRSWQEHVARTQLPAADDPFNLVMDALEESRMPVLEQQACNLERIKRVLQENKDLLCPFRLDNELRRIMSYPL